MESFLVGAAFSALFVWWWIRKGDWDRNDDGHDDSRVVAVTRPPSEVAVLPGVVPDRGFRPDIEGLRAVAVLLVVLYHAGVGAVGGGYVGVDVFFVLSGFLITSLLLRELQATGRVSLVAFWARRARRLLPASGLVLVATLVAGRLLLDGLSVTDLAHDALAACGFAANVRFARVGTDYLASELPPSPLLHYWSLAVEEQFYVVWPGLLALLTVGLRLGRRRLAAVIVVLAGASFALNLWWTERTQPNAFFLLPARAWELLAGAALALVGAHASRVPAAARAALGWAGLGVVVATAVGIGADTAFPGWVAALPVGGTVALVVAGSARRGPGELLAAAPFQWVGARSYAIYLWHFPVLVVAERRWGPLPLGTRLALVALAVVLAAVSYRLVENPVRHARWLSAVPVRSLVMGGWVLMAGVGAAVLVIQHPPRLAAGGVADTVAVVTVATSPATEPVTTPLDSTVPDTGGGATSTTASTTTVAPTTTERVRSADASHDNPPVLQPLIDANQPVLAAAAGTTRVPSNLDPSLGRARNDLPVLYDDGCILEVGQPRPRDCVYGDPAGAATVVLFGDSHAAQWQPALEQIALARGWRLVVHVKKACPDAEIPTRRDPDGTDCAAWRSAVIGLIGEMRPDLVIMSGYRYQQVGAAAGRDPDTVWREGIEKTVAKVRPLTRELVLLGDSATPLGDAPSCLAGHLNKVTTCTSSRSEAVRPSRLAVERDVADAHDAHFVPTSDWMCTDTACPVILGNVLMYRDNSHLTATAARSLVPYLDTVLQDVLAPPG